MNSLTCWKCGEQLQEVILPMSRREECSCCGADQHVCKMCTEFDGFRGCNEPRAEDVSDREKANFCDFFRPSGKQFNKTSNQKEQQAKAKLAALFGEPTGEPDENTEAQLTPAEIAEKKLRDLFGG